MANLLENIEKGLEDAAGELISSFGGAKKALAAAPEVVAALASLAVALEKPLADLSGVVANPLNVVLDVETVSDLKAAWPQIVAFLQDLGVKAA